MRACARVCAYVCAKFSVYAINTLHTIHKSKRFKVLRREELESEPFTPFTSGASMKWPAVVEAWMYGDPAGIADALVARTVRIEAPRPAKVQASASGERDRYYTMAKRAERKLHVKRVMRGKR